jgi:asparagine synthase (glutamine-hydrolysing)
MCGIAGIINTRLSREQLEQKLLVMQRQMHHRGPDDRGIFISRNGNSGVVNTRLAILDLSAAGHQPMTTDDGRFTITFNGEIYNFGALREELRVEGENFKSHSDTEVILKMYRRYGPECVREFEGMFAIGIWDEQEQTFFLARGPLGVKQLYYYHHDGTLVFGSEVRTLLEADLVPKQLSQEAMAGYLLFGAVPEPLTLIEGLLALPAGQSVMWRNGRFEITKFWDVQFDDEIIERAQAVRSVRAELEQTVKRHLVSDVPVGVFLSGGIDSTAIAALAFKTEGNDLRTFCISFDDPQFNEGEVAARTAAHFQTKHTDWRLDSATAKGLLNEFLAGSDQPSIDGFNTFCVSKLAHDNGLKVVLSGLGGDELFGGYQSFQIIPRMVAASRSLNAFSILRSAAGHTLQNRFGSARQNRLGHFLTEMPTTSAAYWAMRGIFTPAEVESLLGRYGFGGRNGTASQIQFHVPPQPTLQDEVSYLELTRYMRNQLLRDSDVMSMAWSLELRVPYVDTPLIEAIQRIPAALRLSGGKKLLLDAVPEIPQWVRNRPKQGFAFPFREWITGEWNDVFRRIETNSPVPLKNWYRCWCLFALESFLARNGIEQLQLAA